MNCSAKTSHHTVYCAVLHSASEVLEHGLQDFLSEFHQRRSSQQRDNKRPPLNHVHLANIILMCIRSQEVHILSIFDRFLQSHSTGDAINPTKNIFDYPVHINHTNDKLQPSSSFENCEVIHGTEKGRCLRLSQRAKKGKKLLSERPYLFCLATPCHCHHSTHHLLVEHLIMAVKLWSIQKDRKDGKYEVNQSKLNTFLFQFYSGLPLPKQRPRLDTDPEDIESDWPFDQLVYLIVVSVIFLLYYQRQQQQQQLLSSNSSNNLDIIRENNIEQAAVDLVEILARLPMNVHAVTSLIEEETQTQTEQMKGQKMTTMQQVTIGYAIFLQASAINHSCQPNAFIQYTTLQPISTTAGTTTMRMLQLGMKDGEEGEEGNKEQQQRMLVQQRDELAWQYSRSLLIDIIYDPLQPSSADTTTEEEERAEEVSISYGPIVSRHPRLIDRRHLLQRQYLFTCHCLTCSRQEQADKLAAEQAEQKARQARLQQQPAHPSQQRIQQSKRIYQVKELCRQLQTMREELEMVNTGLTALFSQQQSAAVALAATSSGFEREVLQSLQQKLMLLGAEYFSPYRSRIKQLLPPSPAVIAAMRSAAVAVADQLPWEEIIYLTNHQLLSWLMVADHREHEVESFQEFLPEYLSYLCCLLDIYGQYYARLAMMSMMDNGNGSGTNISSIGLYKKAAACIHVAITFMLFPSTANQQAAEEEDICIARERVKLMGLLFSTQEWELAGVEAKLAYPRLQQMVKAEDPDLVEVQEMLTNLSRWQNGQLKREKQGKTEEKLREVKNKVYLQRLLLHNSNDKHHL